MPLKNREYWDLDLNMSINSTNGNLRTLRNESAIKRSVRNIVLTQIGERHFNTTFGTNVKGSLFELHTRFTAEELKNKIYTAINFYEPRISNLTVDVTSEPSDYTYFVVITYVVTGESEMQRLEMILQSTR